MNLKKPHFQRQICPSIISLHSTHLKKPLQINGLYALMISCFMPMRKEEGHSVFPTAHCYFFSVLGEEKGVAGALDIAFSDN